MTEKIKQEFMEGCDDELVILTTSDGQEFELEYGTIKCSETIKNLVEDAGFDEPLPLPGVTGKIMVKVVEWCKHHAEHGVSEELSDWDKTFYEMDQSELFDVILAANYLDIKNLLDGSCMTVADMIKGKSPDEIRKTFNIKNDFTKEEEEQVRQENEWAATE